MLYLHRYYTCLLPMDKAFTRLGADEIGRTWNGWLQHALAVEHIVHLRTNSLGTDCMYHTPPLMPISNWEARWLEIWIPHLSHSQTFESATDSAIRRQGSPGSPG